MGRPILIHEFANKELCDEIEKRAKDDFVGIEVKDNEHIN